MLVAVLRSSVCVCLCCCFTYNRLVLVFYFTCYFDISFLPFFIFFFSLYFIIFSLFFFFFLFPFCSLDAAKRKAWKLNRVGSLRNIYSSSSTNTEGNKLKQHVLDEHLSLSPLYTCLSRLAPLSSHFPNAGMEIKFAQSMRAFIFCLQSHSHGLFIFLFVRFILPFMFLSAYLNSDLSL